MKKNWTLDDMPDQAGKIVLITGANDGLGFHLTKAFAQKQAQVIMACRNLEKAEKARHEVLKLYPEASLDIVKLDLGDLQSVKACAETVLTHYDRLDIIMCNGGIMAVPYGKTKDNIELHMGVNYYGHFALIGHLMPLIKKTPGARVVTTSSAAEKLGRLDLAHPPRAENYNRWLAYGDSKLAILMLGLMLDEKFKAAGINAKALSAHPGFAKTNLRKTRLETEKNLWQRFQLRFYELISMPAERGILPLLYAATDPSAKGGMYIAVSGIGEIQGHPKVSKAQKRAYDPHLRKSLWEKSEELTNVTF
ncbi:MAG: SDR family NAD(P)-dependent oxidoreductase [Anaerolineales bacterium]|nr:SDR family NAD(P)-dependent oxidoreductase [Anaerolineales bacterium]